MSQARQGLERESGKYTNTKCKKCKYRQDIQIQNARNANRQERGHGGDQVGGGNFLGWIGSSRRPRHA